MPKAGKSRGWRAHFHFQQVGSGALEDVGKEIPAQRHTAMQRAPQ